MKRLYKLRELPQHLQFNEFILTGYRPPSSFSDCLRSTLHLHNESFNIVSHCETLAILAMYSGTSDKGNLLATKSRSYPSPYVQCL
ncbi:Progestin and adipoQ receptor family member 4 [Geodia barretti]|uniref:Progestin and adipoQ receptor family member 4 n=1 Tax=Geodia barretti TaxID=519541 RepID=A0AA35SFZ7_GEOBA|nr:Progestin and adipoQ receptor family member 4 [Geodia barretti]